MKATGVPQSEIEKDLTLNRQAANLAAKPPKANIARVAKKAGNDQPHRLSAVPPTCAEARVTIPRLMPYQALFYPSFGKITSTLNDGHVLRLRVRPVV